MTHIALQRLYNQRLEKTDFSTPEQVVAWFGAVQAQEYGLAKWALGLRLTQATDAAIEQAFTEGKILRTHIMRPTWHFVTPDDIRWIMALTAPRVQAFSATYYRKMELDEPILARSLEVIANTLQGGKQLMRSELGAALAQAGIVAQGNRLAYILHHAELEALVCSGARRGKQFTYALLEERAPQARALVRDEALAELAKRYFMSHGPAQVKDFAWWSGLTVADAKTGLELCKPHLIEEVIDGTSYWLAAAAPPPQTPSHGALLLPVYDEFVVGYSDRTAVFDVAYTDQLQYDKNVVFESSIMMQGQVAGRWQRTFRKGAVVIESVLYRPFTSEEEDAFAAAYHRYGEFLGMSVVLT